MKYVKILFLICLSFLPIKKIFAETVDIDSLRSAYLFHFTQYIFWSDDALKGRGLVVCAFTQDSNTQRSLLEVFSSDDATTPSVRVIFPTQGYSSSSDLTICRLTFVAQGMGKTYQRFADQFTNLNITVTEGNDSNPGIIHLFIDNGKLRFEIDKVRVRQQTAFKISSKLLRLSKRRQ